MTPVLAATTAAVRFAPFSSPQLPVVSKAVARNIGCIATLPAILPAHIVIVFLAPFRALALTVHLLLREVLRGRRDTCNIIGVVFRLYATRILQRFQSPAEILVLILEVC